MGRLQKLRQGRRSKLVCLLLSSLGLLQVWLIPQTASALEKDLVLTDLISSRSQIKVGENFKIAARFKIKEPWHIYWRNPGEAGLPTRMELDLPQGFSAGPIIWPTPISFKQPGGYAGYGYEDELVLIREVVVPNGLSSGSEVGLKAKLRWLACDELCVPGRSLLSLNIAVGEESIASNTELFESWQARAPARSNPDHFSVETSGSFDVAKQAGSFRFEIEWAIEPESVELIPGEVESGKIEDLQANIDSGKSTIKFSVRALAGQKISQESIESVLKYKLPGKDEKSALISVSLK